jgi:NAD(P)-dependent dehydrogenase (short-subunit alcohol dehydrogenase family)
VSTKQWDAGRIPALDGRVALVTGANSGLGWNVALELARRGAHVVMACRNTAKAEQAAADIRAQAPSASLSIEALDLSKLESVRACASAVAQRHARLDLLVNNAGVMFLPEERTQDGFEIHMASNHLGHFLLTGLLWDCLAQSDQARVVTMSSGLARLGRLPEDDLSHARRHSPHLAYCDSKLANLVFARELAERAARKQSHVKSLAAHPGYAATNLQFGAAGKIRSPFLAEGNRLLMRLANATLAQPAPMGALPALYAATAENVKSGDYIGPSGWMETRGYPGPAQVYRQAADKYAAQRFWALSEQSTGITY